MPDNKSWGALSEFPYRHDADLAENVGRGWAERKVYWEKQRTVFAEQAETPIESAPLLPEPKNWMEKTLQTFSNALFPKQYLKEMPQETAEHQKIVADEAISGIARSKWFLDFYAQVAPMVSVGLVSSYEDYLEVTGSTGEWLTLNNRAEARAVIEAEIGKKLPSVTPSEEVPDWLEISPEEEALVKEFLTQKPKAPPQRPISLSQMTTDQIRQSLTTSMPAVLPPTGVDMEEVLRLASIMEMPEETVGEALDIETAVKVIRDATLEQEQMIRDVKVGIKEWEIPAASMKDKMFFVVTSPMQQFAELIRPYLEHVSYPMAGTVTRLVQHMIPGTQGLENFYDQARAEGLNPWEAAGDAWENWDASWYIKLPIEILSDPITYTPGLLLSVPGKIATKVGMKTLGRRILSVNTGMWEVLDIPFDSMKAMFARFPRSSSQIMRHELDNFHGTLVATVEKNSGKAFANVTMDDLDKGLHAAVRSFQANPRLDGNLAVDAGRYLSEHIAMNEKKVWSWSSTHGGQLAKEFPVEKLPAQAVSEVNSIITDAIMHVGQPAEIAKRMARALGIQESPEHLTRLIKEIPTFTKKLGTDIDTAIAMGKSAKIQPVASTLHYLQTKQRAIIKSQMTGKQASGGFLDGVAIQLQRNVDRLENARWRVVIDRWFVRPIAEANLGSMAYPIWNAFEGIGVSLIEGVTPRFVKWESYNMLTRGLRGDPALSAMTASDIAGIFGKAGGRRAGAFSLLPGAIPEKILGKEVPKWAAGNKLFELTGRSWIKLSDVWGNAIRRNFVASKMAKYLAIKSLNVAGQDINLAMKNIIKGSPRISKESLGLTPHELEQELFRRMTVSKADVLGLKEVLSSGGLQQGEMLKILRKSETLSPRAKSIGEQMISEGRLNLQNLESITAFTKEVSNAAIEDLKRYPFEVGASFKQFASDIDLAAIKSTDDLMEIFSHYEVMSQVASYVPHRAMAQTMDEAGVLYRAGKFKDLEKLWRKSRNEMLASMDDVAVSMNIVRNKILVNADILTVEQRGAMDSVMNRAGANDTLRAATLRSDAELLDDFWALAKHERTPEVHAELRAYRSELWENYRQESAVISASEYVTRKDLAQVYHNLPEPKLQSVDATGKALSAEDIAKVFGTNVDGLSTGLLENVAIHGKPYFIQLVKQTAESRPNLFKGFTEDKIGKVFDDLLSQARMRPDLDIGVQKILQQADGMQHDLINLKMRHSITPDEERALHSWIDNAAKEREKLIGKKGTISQEKWDGLRQESLDLANKDYYKAFADYTNENIVGAAMKMIYPYWTYQAYRWFYLGRTALRHPGLPAAWGKYQNYGEYGYQGTPIPNLEFNPFVGSAIGTTFVLTRFDFASYYENLGWLGEVLDYSQRWGFYPGPQIMLPVALTAALSGRPAELSEILPPIGRSGLNLLIGSDIPGVSDAAKWMKDKIFHENFHEYYTSTLLSTRQIKAEGTLIEGQSGQDVWYKLRRGEKLTAEEQDLWDDCYREAALYGYLRAQFPGFRLKTEEYSEAFDKITNLFHEHLGMTEQFQKELWRNHLRPTDVVGGLPLDLRAALDEMWEYKIFTGRGSILMPPEMSDLYAQRDKYRKRVESLQQNRVTKQIDIDKGFITPTKELHYNGKEWRTEYSKTWNDYAAVRDRMEDPETHEGKEFADAIWSYSPEGQKWMAERLNWSMPVGSPMDEAMELYFDITLERRSDPYSDEEEDDYLSFWMKRESVRMALTEDQRADFDAWIRRYQTPMEATFKQAYNTYIRGYQATSRIVFENYTEEFKPLIREYYSDLTTRARKNEIKAMVNPTTGRKMISEYESVTTEARINLRTASPTLDFWLNIFGYASTTKTTTAQKMLDAFDADKASILIRSEQ